MCIVEYEGRRKHVISTGGYLFCVRQLAFDTPDFIWYIIVSIRKDKCERYDY